MLDILIKNSYVVDGTGNPWYKSDIGINKEKITKIGRISDKANKIIDANELFISPGFIDIHTHSDSTLFQVKTCDSHIMQGITTDCIGNCGSSPFPITEKNEKIVRKRMSRIANGPEMDVDWTNLKGYAKRLQENGLSLNVAPLVGHGTIRAAVIGMEDRAPKRNELSQMKKLVDEAMQNGSFGLSSGLDYLPGSYAHTEEVIELAKVVAKYGGLYASHIREQNLYSHAKAVEELIEIGEKSSVRVHCAHCNPVFPFWGDEIENMRNWNNARKRGVDITADLCIAGPIRSDLCRIIPPWWRHQRGQDEETVNKKKKEFLENLKDPEIRSKIKEDTFKEDWYAPDRKKTGEIPNLNHTVKAERWDDIILCNPFRGKLKNWRLVGKSIAEIAKIQGTEPFDTLCNLIVEEDGDVFGESWGWLTETAGKKLITDPVVMIASDSSGRKNVKPWNEAYSQPHREYPYPHVIGPWVREDGILSLEEMVRKCTSLPARTLGLNDRGIIAEGMNADLVIFDKNNINDKATEDDPYTYPEGIEYVIVNGTIVKEEGKHTEALPGKVLKFQS